MIFDSLSQLWSEKDFEAAAEAYLAGRRVVVSGLKGAATALYLTALQKRLGMPVVLITSGTQQAEEYYSEFCFLHSCYNRAAGSGCPRIVYLPAHDTEPYQGTAPHPQVSALRMQAFWQMRRRAVDILIAPLQAAVQHVAPPQSFDRSFFDIEWGDEKSPQHISEQLRRYGYKEKDLVTSRGEFSLRGGILDVFSVSEELPARMEFFGNRIESMRVFDTVSQRSVREVEKTTVLSLKEIQLTETEIVRWGEFSSARWSGDFYHEELVDKTQQLLESGWFEAYEEFLPAFFEQSSTILDYINTGACLVLNEPVALEEAHEKLLGDYRRRFDQVHEHYRLALEPQEIFQSWQQFQESIRPQYRLYLTDLATETTETDLAFEYAFQSSRQYNGQVQEIVNDILRLQETDYTTFLILPTVGRAERMVEILKEYEAPVLFFHSPFDDEPDTSPQQLKSRIIVSIGHLHRGFKNAEFQIALLTEDDLFGESRPTIQTTTRRAAGKFLSDLRDLKIEDYVVHVDHGIGQFHGLVPMQIEGQNKEFLLLRFADEDRLYVPVERLDLVQKYMGSGDAAPRLDKLGSNVWQKTKSRAKASMKDMAEKLLQLYAYRKTARGFSFPSDDAFQREFEDAFEFQETPHQMAAIEDVKEDMESDKPADRLICGDVGYGKTEVAMRAAFKAVTAGKQVAVLTPTTILAFQHYHTFRKRFEMFPVRVEMVSRFKTSAEIKKTLQDVSEGKVEILIGTHRLLSKDVKFFDLGLLVVDEEQRFGVGHKEKLKEMKKNVDCITLTATPIPRTLQMALMGFRPMSVIETPPKDRLAIQTNIVKYSEDVIEGAIQAELKRGGQVYFVHNRVETIDSMAAMIKRLVPDARVSIAHGQMGESELEKVMLRFINHESDVLVSTTIIENGIDIPLVNTLLVNRADRFGLSQLYQLRGRVGRSHRRAYAYFLIPSEKELTPIARKRLAALREFTELGSGFRLAALDLEIRGAGNLLGGEQHGHIAALGFELYCRMLEQTVRELQGQEAEPDFATNINLNLNIRIPDEYIPNMNQRLNLYKRIASAHSDESIRAIHEEMADRFGPIPEEVENLFEYGRVKMKAEKLQIRSIDYAEGSLFFQLNQNGQVQADRILGFIKKHKGTALSPSGTLAYPLPRRESQEAVFHTVHRLLDELAGTAQKSDT